MTDIYRNGVVLRPVLDLKPGDRVDLQFDSVADQSGLITEDDNQLGYSDSDHPEWEFEYEIVMEVERESDDCIRVDFESGFSCGFPFEHLIEVDGKQIR